MCELLANGDAPNTDKSSSNDTEEKLQEELNTAKLRILDQEKQLNSLQGQWVKCHFMLIFRLCVCV